MTSDPALEAEIRRIAAEIAEGGAGEDVGVFHLSWWSERMLEWAMAHPDFKTQLFRFVDVFPACRTNADVERHLEEYFDEVDIPRAVDLGLGVAEHTGPVGAAAAARVARSNILRMAGQFIAGEGPDDALEALERLWHGGEAFTIDLLGEKTVTDGEADAYAERVTALLDGLSTGTAGWAGNPVLEQDPWGRLPRVNVSVKPTALAPRFAPLTRELGLAEARERLGPVLDRARTLGAQVHFDMEDDAAKDLTLDLLKSLGENWGDGPQLGVAIQAYRKDAHRDVADLAAWSRSALTRPLQIRLVKGAYWDFETAEAGAHHWPSPVFAEKDQTDANYERCVDLLLDEAGALRPAFGSHNLRSLAYAIARARERRLPDDAYELQLLYGMAEPVHAGLRRVRLRTRVYTPIGALVPGMAYLIRRLLENTSNESFVRMRFHDDTDLSALVAPPTADRNALPTLPEAGERPPTDPGDPGAFAGEPHREFHRSGPRARFGAAVEHRPGAFPFDAPVTIDGEHSDVEDGIDSHDPGETAALVCRAGRATIADADHAVAVARGAQPAWAGRHAGDRAGVLFRAAALMRRRRDELAALEVYEAGKPWAEADGDVCEAIDFLEYYGREAIRLAEGAPVDQAPGETNVYRYEPRGVAAAITPWNFPLAIPTGMTAGPLVTGNAVILKPAEQTPGIAFRLHEILLEAGVPPGVVAFLPGIGEEVGAHLVEHPDVDLVTFTGSKAVGLQIVERAGVHREGQAQVKRVVAEMGGKNAVIVDDDADLDVAVPAILTSAFSYGGQKCSACSRVLALEAVFDELVERLVGAARLLVVGHPRDMGTQVGPLIDANAFGRVQNYADLAAEEGEVVLHRGETQVPTGGWYVAPTIAMAPPGCRVTTEEIFGPVLTVTRVGDFDEAIRVANDTDYGLTGGIFSRSPSRIRRAAHEVRAGNFYVNRSITGSLVGRQPFGGVGLSGVGSKAGGPDYLRQFVEPRVVTENTIRQGFAPLEG